MKNIEKISEIEAAVLKFCVKMNVPNYENKTGLFDNVHVIDRIFNGTSFMTEFDRTEELKVGNDGDNYLISTLDAVLNNSIPSGYIAYIENGYITALEGFTYDEEWPDNLQNIEVSV
ncbi:hypothetical protein [Kiloniella sp.]|uniref:hypothetical protein n=1 Tax=Kiloniella sp. TaxID=1938587 RepID=UPI003A953A3F